MNKKELVEAVAGKSGISRSGAAEAVDAVLEVVSASLAAGESVAVPRCVRPRLARGG